MLNNASENNKVMKPRVGRSKTLMINCLAVQWSGHLLCHRIKYSATQLTAYSIYSNKMLKIKTEMHFSLL